MPETEAGTLVEAHDLFAALRAVSNAPSKDRPFAAEILLDQPITGRYTDGENAALGLVDVTDNPHWDTVDGFRNFAKNMFTIRG